MLSVLKLHKNYIKNTLKSKKKKYLRTMLKISKICKKKYLIYIDVIIKMSKIFELQKLCEYHYKDIKNM